MRKLILISLLFAILYSCKKEEGCTDPVATNFNSDAEIDDGSCNYPAEGCTDSTASNYNPYAILSTNTCEYIGCTDSTADNYNIYAIYDDGSCEFSTTPYIIETPFGFPNMIIPDNNPTTIEGVLLGEKLFHDKILSGDESQSCSSCHQKELGFSDGNRFSAGIDGIIGSRNASTLTNSGWNTSFNWDGSVSSLEEQAFEPVVNPIEMHNTWANVETKLNANGEYLQLFKEAFNINYIDSNHVVMAIAQFERTLVSANSKFDRYIEGNEQLSASELSGYAIFNSEKGDCFHCHGTQLFMDNDFHNNGLDHEPFLDIGLASITNNPADNGKFKTPTLRNIEHTAPYMHDGRFSTLEEVVAHYNSGGIYSSTIDPNMKKVGIGLQLTEQEKADLIAYLKTLTDSDFLEKK
ncbi:MAG: cytochrome-c peroxidase [Flavobacteriales bacterium]|nr:cytochrome-c peroxidase [Flavobacteriales bacterium]